MSGIVGSKLNIRGSGLVGSLGTDGQHLLSAGAGKTNVFETVAAASGDCVLLATETASDDATISFDGYFTSDYTTYMVMVSSLMPAYHASNNIDVNMRIRIGDADKSEAKYQTFIHGGRGKNDDTTNDGSITTHDVAQMEMVGVHDNLDATATTSGGWNCIFYIHNPLNATHYKSIVGLSGHLASDGTGDWGGNWHATYRNAATAWSGFTMFMDSGNIATGSISLYGLKNS